MPKPKSRKNRTKPSGFTYLPGATWKDVVAGRPVTADDAAVAKRRKGKRPARCVACGRLGMVKGTHKPCAKCGGKMRIQD